MKHLIELNELKMKIDKLDDQIYSYIEQNMEPPREIVSEFNELWDIYESYGILKKATE